MCKFHFIPQMKILRTLLCFTTRRRYGLRLQAGILPTYCTSTARAACLQPQPPRPVMLLCFRGPRYNWQLWDSESSLRSTSLSSRLRTCKLYTFLLSFGNGSSVLCEKPVHESCQSRNSSTGPSASVMAMSKVQFCHWSFALAAQTQVLSTP